MHPVSWYKITRGARGNRRGNKKTNKQNTRTEPDRDSGIAELREAFDPERSLVNNRPLRLLLGEAAGDFSLSASVFFLRKFIVPACVLPEKWVVGAFTHTPTETIAVTMHEGG